MTIVVEPLLLAHALETQVTTFNRGDVLRLSGAWLSPGEDRGQVLGGGSARIYSSTEFLQPVLHLQLGRIEAMKGQAPQ